MILPKATLLYFFLPALALGQEMIKPQASPLALATCRYKNTYIKITYCQPHKRGREVFGKLVPYGQVWRTGANQATEITVTQDVQVHSNLLKSGTYSLFTIPGEKKWTIVFNSDLGLWGSYNYNPKMDVFRFEVPVQLVPGPIYEPFTITIEQKNDKAEILLLWDNVKVGFPLEFIEPKP